MRKMLLVSQVDGHETKPLKVVNTQLEARMVCIQDATMYLEENTEDFEKTQAAVVQAFDQAWADMNERLFELEGLQFESGVASWDYLIQSVEVAE